MQYTATSTATRLSISRKSQWLSSSWGEDIITANFATCATPTVSATARSACICRFSEAYVKDSSPFTLYKYPKDGRYRCYQIWVAISILNNWLWNGRKDILPRFRCRQPVIGGIFRHLSHLRPFPYILKVSTSMFCVEVDKSFWWRRVPPDLA